MEKRKNGFPVLWHPKIN